MRRLMAAGQAGWAVSVALLMAGAAILVVLGLLWVRSVMYQPMAISEPGVLRVPGGASASSVAAELSDRGWLQWPRVFALWARGTGEAGRIHAGEYDVAPGTTPRELLARMTAGRVKLHPITLLEGWTWWNVRDALYASDVIEISLPYDSPEVLAAALGLKAEHAEGQFFPDTYKVARGTTDRELLTQAARLLQEQLGAAWSGRQEGLPLESPYELLVLASIIERETSLDRERPRVAGVFIRRLKKGMRLQTDPTVIYGLGEKFNGNLTRRDLQTDTPYNTYTRGGLPPTPIALPSAASLRAAAHPADGDELYFVASPALDGSHVFSATLAAHNQAVAAYVKALRRARSSKGERR